MKQMLSPTTRIKHYGLLFCLVILIYSLTEKAFSQKLRVQSTPNTVWIDFKKLNKPNTSLSSFPIWLESIEIRSPKLENEINRRTTFRIRLLTKLNNELMLRLFFKDEMDLSPVISAWSETGTQLFQSELPGEGLGLQTSENLRIPMDNVDYVDIDVSGDGSNIRGVFLTCLKRTQTQESIDFNVAPEVIDPFKAAFSSQQANTNSHLSGRLKIDNSSQNGYAQPGDIDEFVYGRVHATLDNSTVKLTPREHTEVVYEFELESQPLLAVVTFEILNPEIHSPPAVFLNQIPIGQACIVLPDLADPAYFGIVRPLENDMQFSYTGWLKCQRMIAGTSLQTGLNSIMLQINNDSGPVAIRAVKIQLKYNWNNVDYILSPFEP